MSTIKIIVSDLHLADGSSILDCFTNNQQSAFEGLLHAASTGSFGSIPLDASVELIINGDCFDFLVTTPYATDDVVDPQVALLKIEKIIAAHGPFFAALRSFITLPERSVTFITGNHDLELCFAAVRARICTAIIGQVSDPRVYFCPTRFYYPLPTIYVEHGNFYDFWNHAIQGLWDEQGQPLTRDPERITLSVGSLYFQRAAYQISLRCPYFDHFEPSLNITPQIAMLSLLLPALITETAQCTMQLLSYPRTALTNLLSEEENIPVRLFEEAMIDFLAFQQDRVAHKLDWTSSPAAMQVSPAEVQEFMQVRAALSLPLEEALRAICAPDVYHMGESVAAGMHTVLQQNPQVRYAIAGHTHMLRNDALGAQTYLNTASWTQRLAVPAPAEITPELIAWLRAPDWNAIPLRDVTQLVFALVTASADEPASARLCVWEDDVQSGQGNYRVLT